MLTLAWMAAPPAVPAQTPELDSLRAEIKWLRARLDSLERILQARGLTLPPDTAQGADELERLRARARAAAARADSAAVAPAPPMAGPSNLNRLNPEITVTGDIRGRLSRDGPQEDPFDPREFEFSFQSVLDPFAATKIFLAFEEGELDLEEAYAYWTGLPGRLRVDVGKLRHQFGELNRWHLHAVPESEYPLALRTYLGEEGLAQTGVGLYWTAPAGVARGTHEAWLQLAKGDNEALFDGGSRVSYLAHVNNFWQLSPSTFIQIGTTGMYGENPDAALFTRAAGVDWRLTWRPPAEARFREFTLRSETMFLNRDGPVSDAWRVGGYVGAQYRLGRRWILGLRYDYVQAPEGPLDHTWALVPSLTFWQSEWAYLRAELLHQEDRGLGARIQSLTLQAVWAIGPHKHETY